MDYGSNRQPRGGMGCDVDHDAAIGSQGVAWAVITLHTEF